MAQVSVTFVMKLYSMPQNTNYSVIYVYQLPIFLISVSVLS